MQPKSFWHNHPSGSLKPSAADTLTNATVKIGKLLDMPVIDDVIITSEGYYSFVNEGAL